ncbi:hypothetical protein IAT38_008138 [Cryptococcus sp. DSM 104549]
MQQLLNPFAQKYPDTVDSTLVTQGVSAKFNPSGPFAGHYLAVGGSDGLVEVWDVETKGILRTLEGHSRHVGGLSWSRNNRFLLTASLDGLAIIWDLSSLSPSLLNPKTPLSARRRSRSNEASTSSPRRHTLRFDSPLVSASFHPRNSQIVLTVLSVGEVVLVDLRKGGGRYKLEDVAEGGQDEVAEETTARKKVSSRDPHCCEPQLIYRRVSMTCAAWSPDGSRIYAGTSHGMLYVIDPLSRYVLQRIKLATATIRQLTFDASGQHLITSATDRALRLLTVDPLTQFIRASHRFQDLVNRTPWHSIGFSGDAEYVMGGAGHKMAHNVFVWDRESGVLVKVLEGPKEPLLDSDWHPTKPMIVSIATSGDVHLWQTSSPDNWAAFAPGFEELEENVEYDEREDEFDIEDETELSRRKDLEEDILIDVLTPQEDSFPRRPRPVLTIPPNITFEDEEQATRMERLVSNLRDVVRWADASVGGVGMNGQVNGNGGVEGEEEVGMDGGAADGDDWEGFYLSVDLLMETRSDDENGN